MHLVSGGFDDLPKKLPVTAESHSYVVTEEVKESLYLPMDR